MLGFKATDRKPVKKFANGGPVRGPGTGTSDEVPREVPEGTFIMPADSTQAIGEQQLQGLGFRGAAGRVPAGGGEVPVNLSNGEFELPPEQVHALGVQSLMQMKNATHAPVPELDTEGQPRTFFANGGVVEDPSRNIARYVNHRGPSPQPPSPQLQLPAPPPANALQARPNFTMGGNPGVPPVSGPEIQDVRPKYNPANGSPEAKAWQAQRAAGFNPVGAQASATTPPAAAKPMPKPVAQAAGAAPNGAGYRAGAAVGRAAGPLLRAASAVAVPAVLAGTATSVAATPTSDYESRFGFGPNNYEGFGGFARDVGVRALGAATDLVDGIGLGFPGQALFADKQAGQAAAQPVPNAPAATNGPAVPTGQPVPLKGAMPSPGAPSAAPVAQPEPQPALAMQGTPGIYRQGNSFSDTAAGAAGVGGLRAGGPSAQNMAAAAALAERSAGIEPQAAGFNPVQMPQLAHSGNDWQSANDLRNLQVSANSITNKRKWGGEGANSNDARVYQQALAADLAQRGGQNPLAQGFMQEQGANARAALRESGDNSRAIMGRQQQQFGNQIAQSRLAMEQAGQGFQLRDAERAEKLRERYESAKPEDRKAIAQQIRDLNGSAQPNNRYTVVPGGQEWDAKASTMRNVPARVLDNQSGSFIDQPAGALPSIESNPDVQQIMNNTALSREERAKQIRALGYK